MRLLLDTNVVLDYLGVNDGYEEDAEALKDSKKAVSLIKDLREYIKVLPVTDDDIGRAIERDWKDFEDAVQYSVAESNRVDYIISRNKKDFEEDEIPCMTPREFLDFYER